MARVEQQLKERVKQLETELRQVALALCSQDFRNCWKQAQTQRNQLSAELQNQKEAKEKEPLVLSELRKALADGRADRESVRLSGRADCNSVPLSVSLSFRLGTSSASCSFGHGMRQTCSGPDCSKIPCSETLSSSCTS